jgi:hypothetical protein
MIRRLLVMFGLLPVLLVGCSSDESDSSAPNTPEEKETIAAENNDPAPIEITCVPSGGIQHTYQGSVIGPGGELSDGDEFMPYITLKDGTQEILLNNAIYDVYVQQAGLDPVKKYTFEIIEDESSGSHRISRILDGKAVKYDAPASGSSAKR